MSGYFGFPVTPPRAAALWDAVVARLDTATMARPLGGAGRIRLESDELTAEAAESEVWGRVVVVPVRRASGEGESRPGRRRVTPFLVRAEVHAPEGSAYRPALALEAAQDEAFAQLHGWIPGAFAHGRVTAPLWRQSDPPTLPLWDEATGLWYLSSEYRAVLAPL